MAIFVGVAVGILATQLSGFDPGDDLADTPGFVVVYAAAVVAVYVLVGMIWRSHERDQGWR